VSSCSKVYPLGTLQLQAPWAYVRYWICAWNTWILNRHMYDHDNHRHDHHSHWNVVMSWYLKNSFNSHHELWMKKRTEQWYFNGLSLNSIWSFTRRFQSILYSREYRLLLRADASTERRQQDTFDKPIFLHGSWGQTSLFGGAFYMPSSSCIVHL